MIQSYHSTPQRRMDPLDIHVRLILLADQIEALRDDLSPVKVLPFAVALARLNTAIALESINFDVMESVVSSLREGVQMFALHTSHGASALYLMDLAEDVLADLPIPHSPQAVTPC